MAARFHPRLINGPYDDPALYVALAHEKRALLFDLGTLHDLSPRDLLKISHCFVSHTHMDHFCGLDHLLRLCLGRDKHLHLYGPEGFLANLEGKLRGYNWNLVDRYRHRLELTACEIRRRSMRTRRYACRNRFIPQPDQERQTPFDGLVLDETSLRVYARVLDHGIPCLGFRLAEPVHIHIDKVALDRLSLATGPWLRHFKQALYEKADPSTRVSAPILPPAGGQRQFSLGALAAEITRTSPGQAIGYITDVAGHLENQRAIVDLVSGVDHLFIESPFRARDDHLAEAKFHLTTEQAGQIAARAGVQRCTLFHFSPRYHDAGATMRAEAERAYRLTYQSFAGQEPSEQILKLP